MLDLRAGHRHEVDTGWFAGPAITGQKIQGHTAGVRQYLVWLQNHAFFIPFRNLKPAFILLYVVVNKDFMNRTRGE